MIEDLATTIIKTRPGAIWSCGDTYESIVWLDESQSKPTLQELEEAWVSIKAEKLAKVQQLEALSSARLQMAAILDALPVADRAIVLPIRTNAEAALNRLDVELALYIVQTAVIPESLEATRQQIIALFPQ